MVVHSAQVYIQLKPLFSRHNGIGVQFTDEPTGNLDGEYREKVIQEIVKINREFHKTVIIVTHDPYVASFCDRVLFLEEGNVKEMPKEKMNP